MEKLDASHSKVKGHTTILNVSSHDGTTINKSIYVPYLFLV